MKRKRNKVDRRILNWTKKVWKGIPGGIYNFESSINASRYHQINFRIPTG